MTLSSSSPDEESRKNDLRYLYGLLDFVSSSDDKEDWTLINSIRLVVSSTVGDDGGGVYKPLLNCARVFGLVGVWSRSSVSVSPSPATEMTSRGSTLEVAIETESNERVVLEHVEGVGEVARDVMRDKEEVGPREGRPLAASQLRSLKMEDYALEGVSLLRLETLPLRPLPPGLELTLNLFLDPISSSFLGGIFSLPCPGRLGPREK
jgi:hypothetical protein